MNPFAVMKIISGVVSLIDAAKGLIGKIRKKEKRHGRKKVDD